ncbi:hypothetical protein FOA52_001347 [Chlamydomonas sp. UWO 241]|nr:hypothetical protein FOA52_001347 [Chlamydomonas sp. UWO 241]
MSSVEAAPKEVSVGVVKRVEGSIAEVFDDAEIPFKVLLRCKVNSELQSGEQEVVVSRPEDGSGWLAMRIMEPMLSLVKRHKLCTCTLDRDTNAALPVLTMVMVTRATGTAASSPPQSAASRPAAAAKQAPASLPTPTRAPAQITGIAAAQHEMGASSLHQPHEDLLQTGALGADDDQLEARQVSQVGGDAELEGQGAAGSLGFSASAQQLAALFGNMHVELPMLLLLRCHIDEVLQPYQQRASLRSQGHDTALWLKDPMLSLMRGRRTLLWSLAPAQGGTSSLPEMTVELGDFYTLRRPPASQSLPSQPTTCVTGSGNQTTSDSSDGSDSEDDEQAHGRRGHKRSAIAAATNAAAAAAETPPAKKGRSQAHDQQLPSGAAKDAQKRKAPSEQPVAAAKSLLRGVSLTGKNWRAQLWDRDARFYIYLGPFGSEEEAARAYDRVSMAYCGTETETNFPLTDYDDELPQLREMTREEVVAHVQRGGKGLNTFRGATQVKSGRWEARARIGGRVVYLGAYDTKEDAAHVYDFAVLSVRGIDTRTVNNFDRSAYLGANGALLPVEAALPGLRHDKLRLVHPSPSKPSTRK